MTEQQRALLDRLITDGGLAPGDVVLARMRALAEWLAPRA